MHQGEILAKKGMRRERNWDALLRARRKGRQFPPAFTFIRERRKVCRDDYCATAALLSLGQDAWLTARRGSEKKEQ